MGIKYLRADEILENKNKIAGHFFKPSTFTKKEFRNNYFSNYIKKKVGLGAKIVELGCGGGNLCSHLLAMA